MYFLLSVTNKHSPSRPNDPLSPLWQNPRAVFRSEENQGRCFHHEMRTEGDANKWAQTESVSTIIILHPLT